ncbi:hypothetical protein M569_03692, partial [Genlisea aurea]
MWSSVATLKESLTQIANGVHDDEDDQELSSIYTPPRQRLDAAATPDSNHRDFGNLNPADSPIVSIFGLKKKKIHQYKSEIKRLQESEAEIKALSVNYAALLKEKEDQISRLSDENGTLKRNLVAANAVAISKKVGIFTTNHEHRTAAKVRSFGRLQSNGILRRTDELGDEIISSNAEDSTGTKYDRDTSQERYEGQIKQLVEELDNERGKFASVQSRLQEEQKLSRSLQQELSSLKDENSKVSSEMQKAYDELNQKIQEIGTLQMELRNKEELYGTIENLRNRIAALEDENQNIKKEKVGFEDALKAVRSYPARKDFQDDVPPETQSSSMNETSVDSSETLKRLRKLEKDVQESSQERDKALKELKRLKKHLLEKESEESEKMDEDTKIIEELRSINERQRTQVVHLEHALSDAHRIQAEMKASHNDELSKAKNTVEDLNKRLSSSLGTLHAKNTEIHNLQTALGQYYAEIEAKERLVEELSVKRDELARVSNQLQEALRYLETSKKEKEEMLSRQSQLDSMLGDGKKRIKKLEEDNEKLRRALEQSMTRLNRMSVDSDFLVDRRIVIKLLVTYLQRNHSKEVVLDLMVRMLGFSVEDKQRIGIAEEVGGGLVRGVLGLPGRLVGGMLSSGSGSRAVASSDDHQSFADLWVDFLLQETEREK